VLGNFVRLCECAEREAQERIKVKKYYCVNYDMVWSKTILVKADNKPEAKKIAFEKLLKKLRRNDFRVDCWLNGEG
jgi:hypothetical protein